MECYENLKISLMLHYPGMVMRSILFTSCALGNGACTTAMNFAKVLSRDTRKGVLLLELGAGKKRREGISNGNGKEQKREHDDPHVQEKRIFGIPVWIGPGNLYTIVRAKHEDDHPRMVSEEIVAFQRMMDVMKEQFDYIIVDAPPAHGFPETLALASKVDGVILVIESGATRQQVANKAKQRLESMGGKVLGVVLNKRRYHIPDFIYKRL